MDDHITIVETPRGRFRLMIWETNKAWTLGYVRWSVSVSIAFGRSRYWYELDSTGKGWTTLDRAEREADRAMAHWSTHFNAETMDDTPLPANPAGSGVDRS